jgi:hypothetical protein
MQSPSRPRFSPTDASSSSRPRRHGRTSRPRRHGWRSDLGPRRHGRSSDLGPRRHIRTSDLGPRRHGRARNASPWPDSSPRRRRTLLAPSRRPRCTSLTGTCTERAGCRRTGPPDAKPVYSTHLPSTAFARGRRRLRRCFRSVAAAAADGRRAIAASPWLEGALARPEGADAFAGREARLRGQPVSHSAGFRPTSSAHRRLPPPSSPILRQQ